MCNRFQELNDLDLKEITINNENYVFVLSNIKQLFHDIDQCVSLQTNICDAIQSNQFSQKNARKLQEYLIHPDYLAHWVPKIKQMHNIYKAKSEEFKVDTYAKDVGMITNQQKSIDQLLTLLTKTFNFNQFPNMKKKDDHKNPDFVLKQVFRLPDEIAEEFKPKKEHHKEENDSESESESERTAFKEHESSFISDGKNKKSKQLKEDKYEPYKKSFLSKFVLILLLVCAIVCLISSTIFKLFALRDDTLEMMEKHVWGFKYGELVGWVSSGLYSLIVFGICYFVELQGAFYLFVLISNIAIVLFTIYNAGLYSKTWTDNPDKASMQVSLAAPALVLLNLFMLYLGTKQSNKWGRSLFGIFI